MRVALEEFGLGLKVHWVSPSSRCYRPPSWPPPRDWVVSEDQHGNVLSRYADDFWDLTPWAGKSFKIRFDGGCGSSTAQALDAGNADLMRLLATWFMWGPRAARSTGALKQQFESVRKIVALCSSNGILANDLMRFPKILDQVPSVLSPSAYEKSTTILHRLWDAREMIGVTLIDQEGIKRLVEAAPTHKSVQTAYIPPRIWSYQIQRLRECMNDFAKHQRQIEDCFNFCLDAYAQNYGPLQNMWQLTVAQRNNSNRTPFQEGPYKNAGICADRQYHGRFELTATRYGIKDLLERWVSGPHGCLGVRQFSAYLSLIQYAGLTYIANFTLQRIDEAMSLRTDCLIWETDEKLGRVPIVCGETTKTDPDSDARWPTSPSVEMAVDAMTLVARLRLRCAITDPRVGPSEADQANPYLFDRAFEPWNGGPRVPPYAIRPYAGTYQGFLARYPRLFDPEQLRITEDDLRTAQMITPNLSADKGFTVGEVWPLAWHQLRRTTAVNMFASGLLSDSSMQVLMKHSSRLMPLYYGRGYTKLHLNAEVEAAVVATMYEIMAKNLLSANTDRYVSPMGPDRKRTILVSLIADKDVKALAAAGRRGETSFRETRLGACTKLGHCGYGGIESVARCAGGDGGGPCVDALFDKNKAQTIEKQMLQLDQDLQLTPVGSPRHRALRAERTAMENYLNVVRI